ncbi:MAG: N4-gp56 family major capsid protein [Pseudomonadota bacterium]
MTQTSTAFAATVERKIDRKALEVAQRYLVLHGFADKKKMDKRAGLTWTATRWNRLPLPQAPVAEGVPPNPNSLTFTQVTGTALQWAGRIVFSDVAVVATQWDLLEESSERLGMQIAETKERNGFQLLSSGTQVNYVNSRGARANLVAGDTLDPNTVTRTQTDMKLLGVPLWNGQTGETIQRSIDYTARESEKTIKGVQHLVAIADPRVLQDLRSNPTVVQTWQFSDHNRMYINEMGYWSGITFCESNMMPNWFGIAQVNGSPGTGSLTTGTYTIQVTGWDNQNFYESQIYQVSADISVIAGGITLTTPSTPGFTYAVYVGVGSASAPFQLGLSTAGPPTGPYLGQAIAIPPSTAVTITGLGLAQIPPAAPATGVTVFRTYIFGQRAFSTLKLEDVEWHRLTEADKSDPHNQLRVIGWKYFEGWVVLNQQFLAGIESTASNTGAFG